MSTKMYRIGIILSLCIGLAFAMTISNSEIQNNITNSHSEGFVLRSSLNNSTTRTVNINGSNSDYDSETKNDVTTTAKTVNINGSNSDAKDYEHESETEDESVTEMYDSGCQLSEMPPEPSSKCCGIDVSSSPRITGGSPTLINQYPWLVLIEYLESDGKLYARCGGSLISGLFVLTAAHCHVGTPWSVVLGDYNRTHSGRDCVQGPSGEELCSDGELRIRIEKWIKHQYIECLMEGKFMSREDIALIKLKKMVAYTNSIRPICLPSSDLNDASESFHNDLMLTAAGWGVTKPKTKVVTLDGETVNFTIRHMSDVKMHVQLPYQSLEDCARVHDGIVDVHVCTGKSKNGENVCSGDSGGPLMFNNDTQYELTGIASRSSTPCELGLAVFTNVYKFKEWIMDKIEQEVRKLNATESENLI